VRILGYLLGLRIALWAGRMLAWLVRWMVIASALILAAPVATVATVAFAGAWLRGWPPTLLRRAAAWSLPMTLAYLAATAATARSAGAVLAAPYVDWRAGWHALAGGGLGTAFVLCAPVAVPAGLLVASWAWQYRIYTVETGLAGRTATAPVVFDARQWRRQARAALGRLAAPGTVPLIDGKGRIVAGTVIRAVGHPYAPVLALPWQVMGRHSVVIGASGCGKTNLMMRLWAGWYAAALHAHHSRGSPRPLLVVLDCKGGPDSRVKADRAVRLLHGAGARRVAVWPDQAALSLWTLPARELALAVYQMLGLPETGPAAYYSSAAQTVLSLAVCAPCGPPAGAADLLTRLDAGWLAAAWAADPPGLAALTPVSRHVTDVALRVRALLERLGPGFEGQATLDGADAWYFILEGTREHTVAEAQAMAVTDLLAHAVTALDTQPRAVLLAVDDYSAVSRRVPLHQLYERGRSLGIGVQVSAQSWHGLGADEDERHRIAATADGGIWLMRTPFPEPIVELAGTRQVIETATKVIGWAWGDEGSSRVQHAWTADPGITRRLATGQAGYIRAGGCTWLQVARPRPSPLPLPAARIPAEPVVIPPPSRDTGHAEASFARAAGRQG
jgi:hypothetical protein